VFTNFNAIDLSVLCVAMIIRQRHNHWLLEMVILL